LAGAVASGSANVQHRTTFGLPSFVHPRSITLSEQGSLHSMRSHLAPNAVRSTGSAPTSLRHVVEGSYGSGSSRPSAHSGLRSASTDSNSVTSDGRRRLRASVSQTGPISPPMSAIGRPGRTPVGDMLTPYPTPPGSPPASPPSSPFGASYRQPTTSMSSNADTTLPSVDSDPASPSQYFHAVPWAAGLNSGWTPT